MSKLGTITRRTFLIGSVAIAGGAAFGYYKYKQPFGNPLENNLDDGASALTPYVLIDQNGINIIAPRAEMGQGTHTTLAALVAEELDIGLDQVKVLHGPASKAYYNEAVLEEAVPYAQTDQSSMAERMRHFTKVPAKFLAMQITGGSSSTPDAFVKMRLAGAAARESLVEAAAQRLNVATSSLKTIAGTVVDNNGNAIAYADLAVSAAKVELKEEPKLKPQSQWKILGKSQPRVDAVGKSTGTAEFGIDVTLPDMLYASIKTNPKLGAPMNSFKADKAKAMPGVKKVFQVNNGVVVVASNTWYAMKAVNAVEFEWADAAYPANTNDLQKAIQDSFTEEFENSKFRDDGDVEDALKQGDVISGEYFVPYLAHATMEPMNATAWLRNGKLDVWAGNQNPTQAVKEAVTISGLPEDKINIHTTLMGGGFGRRAEMDFVIQAIKVAVEMEGTPVKLTWSREEDTTHDYYRPMGIARFKAVMGDKTPIAYHLELAGPSPVESQMGRIGLPMAGPDVSIAQATWDQPYGIENFRVTGYKTPAGFPVSSWRSVGASQNGFFHESAIDELAHAKGLDPLQMRLNMLTHEPSKKVLDKVRDMSGWGSPLPTGHARGVAFVLSFGVPVAEVIEIAMQGDKVKIVNAYAAVDVGIALDPSIVKAQVMSGINFGLAAAMMSEITVQDGAVQQTNFHNYNSIRMNQAPNIEVAILENGEKIRGIGEPGLPPAAPALANAIYAATGRRIRELPLKKHIDFA